MENFTFLLDEKQQRILALLRLYLKADPVRLDLDTLRANLGLSIYQLHQLMEDVLEILDEQKMVQVEYNSNKGLLITGLNTKVIKIVTANLAKKSIRLKVFLHEFLGSPKNHKKLLKEIGLSRSSFYQIRENVLSEISVEVHPKTLGQEMQLRYFILNVLFYFSLDLFFVKGQKQQQVKKTFRVVVLNWQLTLSNTQRKQLFYFLAIQFLRTSQTRKEFLNDDSSLILKNHRLSKLITHFCKQWNLSSKTATNEALFLNSFLALDGFVLYEEKIPLVNFDDAKKLTKQQLQLISNKLHKSITAETYPNFTRGLFLINSRSLSPFFFINTFIRPDEVPYFKETYPMVNNIAFGFIKLRSHFNVQLLSTEEVTQLYYSYVFQILNETETTDFTDTVNITVDFSQGVVYTKYILNQLKQFDHLNISINKALNNATDLYLSDTYDPALKKLQVIWENPPLALDWALLGNMIVKIKNEKNKGSEKHE
ncbi:hypothetical protein [Ligilactobacillus acidipiscis]|uniref:hypothetical protein n=1 Tax=Ligilactobacillus acidipiscis TaxID=89059 RepID=UPI0023F9FF5B|nr:hypothetical protein [Ligilactobacillus acidipiscis]WEV58173.1 hypothetical protein OZX66_12175 [Ligilactobacillus acidipiscis]